MLICCNCVIFININYIFNLDNTKIAIIIVFFPCFPKTWNGITVLTSTDFFSLRLRKLVYCKEQPLRNMLVTRMADHSLHPVPMCSTYHYYFHHSLFLDDCASIHHYYHRRTS